MRGNVPQWDPVARWNLQRLLGNVGEQQWFIEQCLRPQPYHGCRVTAEYGKGDNRRVALSTTDGKSDLLVVRIPSGKWLVLPDFDANIRSPEVEKCYARSFVPSVTDGLWFIETPAVCAKLSRGRWRLERIGRLKWRSRGLTCGVLLATSEAKDYKERPLVVPFRAGKKYKSQAFDAVHSLGDFAFPHGESCGDTLSSWKTGVTMRRRWIVPEKLFFTKRVLSMPLSDRVLTGGQSDLVLPFRKEIFDYFTAEELKKYFTWRSESDGIVAELSVPIGGADGGAVRLVCARRRYEREDIVTLPAEARVPVLALWPDFRAPEWEHNYCYCWMDNRTANVLELKPVDAVEEAVRPGSPWEGRVWRTNELTSGFECIYTQGVDRIPAGVIVPNPGRFPTPREGIGAWDVGIDFGTSNTTIAYRSGQNALPVPVRVNDRVVLLSCFASDMELAGAKDVYLKPAFFPCQSFPEWPPIRPNGVVSSTCVPYRSEKTPQVVMDAALLPLDCMQDFSTYLWLSGGADVRSNLKWAREPEVRQLIAIFLQHTLLLVAAEARAAGVRQLSVHWSYPSAMPGWMVTDLGGKWEDIKNRFVIDEGAQARVPRTGVALQMGARTTESEAVCRYFVNRHKARLGGNGLITMDVGGGTTDIAVWQGGKLKMQSSVLLSAGVVPEFLANSEDAFRELIEDVAQYRWDDYGALWSHPEKYSKIAAALNLILRLGGQDFLARLRTHGVRDGGVVPRMRSLVLFTFAAMMHYAGLCLRACLCPEGQGETALDAEVHIGGNGAKMVNWVALEGDTLNALRTVLRRASEPNVVINNLRTGVTDAPKQEAASGLLLPQVAEAGKETAASMLIGEQGYRYEGVLFSWNDDLARGENADFLKNRGGFTVPAEFPELMRFLSFYDEAARGFGLTELTEVVGRNQGGVKAAVETKLHHPNEPLNPFFVEEVRAVMEDHLLGIHHDADRAAG